MSSGPVEGASDLRGRTVIRTQAIRRVAEALVAEAVGVRAGSVHADLGDRRGRLAVSVTTPLDPGGAGARSGTLVQRAGSLAEEVATGLRSSTGRTVGEVLVHFTGTEIHERRVR